MRFLRTVCWICAFLGMLHVSIPARSQGPDTNTQAPGSPPVQPPAAAAAPVSDQSALKPAELDALVAPVALYPDTLLANVLMASTYPLEVVRAERWVNQNKNLKDDALKAAAEKQPWDASVKSLVAAPEVLQLLSERLDWTQKLGEAFLAQEKDVMDAGRSRAGRSSTSSPLSRKASTFPGTNRRWSTATGPTATIRRIPITGVIPATSPPA